MENTAKSYPEAGWWLSWYGDPPTNTRDRILFAAFCEAHVNGFQAASIQNIIRHAGVTKGALYHYFGSKDEIGFALLDEVFTRYIDATFVHAMADTDDPITTLSQHLIASGERMQEEDIALGCPLDRFAEDMAPINTEFQQRIQGLYEHKRRALADAFRRGQAAGTVTDQVSAESIALFIQATLQGCMGLARNARSLATLMQCGECLLHYLDQLRPENNPAAPKPVRLHNKGN